MINVENGVKTCDFIHNEFYRSNKPISETKERFILQEERTLGYDNWSNVPGTVVFTEEDAWKYLAEFRMGDYFSQYKTLHFRIKRYYE